MKREIDMKITWLIFLVPAGMLAILLAAFFMSRWMIRWMDRRTHLYQSDLLQKHCEEVQNMYRQTRGWRHDYHNHMQSVKAYLAMDSLEEARAYLDALEQDLDEINLLFNTGNINADAVLNAKISLAIKKGIQVDYKAAVPKTLAVSDIDLCVVIGNLIDNAVESCEKVAPENQFIRLYIGIFQKQLYLSVSNATSETVRKLDEQYISTKRGNHGHGLKRINKIVDKYGGFVNRKNEPGVFVTEILLPL